MNLQHIMQRRGNSDAIFKFHYSPLVNFNVYFMLTVKLTSLRKLKASTKSMAKLSKMAEATTAKPTGKKLTKQKRPSNEGLFCFVNALSIEDRPRSRIQYPGSSI